MKKLKLNLDDLKIDSFETTKVSIETKGTVNGNVSELGTCTCPDPTGCLACQVSPQTDCIISCWAEACPPTTIIC